MTNCLAAESLAVLDINAYLGACFRSNYPSTDSLPPRHLSCSLLLQSAERGSNGPQQLRLELKSFRVKCAYGRGSACQANVPCFESDSLCGLPAIA